MRNWAWSGLVAAALALAAPAAGAAPTEKEALVPPASADMQDARGKVKAKENARGRTMKVEVKRLQANRSYEIRRRGETAALGTLTTNRKGKAKAKISEDAAPAPQALEGIFDGGNDVPRDDGGDDGGGDNPYGDGDCGGGDGGIRDPGYGYGGGGYGGGGGGGNYYPYYPYDPGCEEPREDPCSWYCVEIVDPETGERVLECEGEEHDDPCDFPVLEDYELGYADFCGEAGEFASVVLQRYTFEEKAYEAFYLSLLVPVPMEDCWGWVEWKYYDLIADQDTGLPLGVDSVKELEGRPFEIRDGEGNAVIAGDLPLLESWGDLPFYGPAGGDGGGGEGGGDGGGGEGDADYTLWIDDGSGTLVEAGDLREVPLYYTDDPNGGVR